MNKILARVIFDINFIEIASFLFIRFVSCSEKCTDFATLIGARLHALRPFTLEMNVRSRVRYKKR